MQVRRSFWLITGLMASGKSSVGQALAERLDPSVHLRGDTFRKMIVKGRASMSPPLSPEAENQLRLRYQLAHDVAVGYLNAGFSVVYQDIVLGPHLLDVAMSFNGCDLRIVVLNPSFAVIAERDRKRSKTGYAGGWTPERLGAALADTPRLGLWLDTSERTVDDTVTQILASEDKARVAF
jgi:chloramphenicol 3-O-phosphotransferase